MSCSWLKAAGKCGSEQIFDLQDFWGPFLPMNIFSSTKILVWPGYPSLIACVWSEFLWNPRSMQMGCSFFHRRRRFLVERRAVGSPELTNLNSPRLGGQRLEFVFSMHWHTTYTCTLPRLPSNLLYGVAVIPVFHTCFWTEFDWGPRACARWHMSVRASASQDSSQQDAEDMQRGRKKQEN